MFVNFRFASVFATMRNCSVQQISRLVCLETKQRLAKFFDSRLSQLSKFPQPTIYLHRSLFSLAFFLVNLAVEFLNVASTYVSRFIQPMKWVSRIQKGKKRLPFFISRVKHIRNNKKSIFSVEHTKKKVTMEFYSFLFSCWNFFFS